MIRLLFLHLPLLAAACATAPVDEPSLAPRAAESIDPRIPISEIATPGPADAGLASIVEARLSEARAGESAFNAAVPGARALAKAAGAEQSESWIAAQMALARLENLRAPVATASADIDQLVGRRIEESGGITTGDLALLDQAAAELRAIADEQFAIMADIRATIQR